MQFIASKKVIKYIMQDKNITMVVNNITVLWTVSQKLC
jgi:hypothetical protein